MNGNNPMGGLTTTILLMVTTSITTIVAVTFLKQYQQKKKRQQQQASASRSPQSRDCETISLPNWLYEYYDKKYPVIHITLPLWLYEYYDHHQHDIFVTDDDMMKLSIEISYNNAIIYKIGAPFGCAIYQRHKGTGMIQLYSIGVNYDEALCNCTLHAEHMTIQFAQHKYQNHTLRTNDDIYEYIMVSSCEPCYMCLGSIMYSGVSILMTGATKDDVEGLGLYEGPIVTSSYDYLIQKQSITMIKKEILRPEAARVLQEYYGGNHET